MPRKSALSPADDALERVRSMCLAFPEADEKLSHGAPTFHVRGRLFVMFANNHHNDGHMAIWIPAAPGEQEALINADPRTYFRPPYVGVKGWVGIELARIGDEDLAVHIGDAWRIVLTKPAAKAAQGRAKATKASFG